MTTRSSPRKLGIIVVLAALALVVSGLGPAQAQILRGSDVPKYEVPLPILLQLGLRVNLQRAGAVQVNIQPVPGGQDLGLNGDAGQSTLTNVWGYQWPGLPTTYPGATIVARTNDRVNVRFNNMLPGANQPFASQTIVPGTAIPVDQSLHMAKPNMGWPVVTHLHGGHNESASDGLPEAWYTQNFAETGAHFVKRDYRYDNTQQGATLWYHDHALGITRLNVYAGLAGFYLQRDDNEDFLIENEIIPSGEQEIEIVIQDRMFTTGYQLFMPSTDEPEECPLPDIGVPCSQDVDGEPANGQIPEEFPDPSIVAEFFGNIILVNGKAWPTLHVGQGKYRFRLLNGSDSRFYVLQFNDNPTGNALPRRGDYRFAVIGTDDGFLNEPVVPSSGGNANTVVIAPGERYDVVFDFSGFDARDRVYLTNLGADSPFKGFTGNGALESPEFIYGTNTQQIMEFVVDPRVDVNPASVVLGTDLRPILGPIPTPPTPDTTRQLALFEGLDNFGRLQPLLGTVADGSLAWFEPITENPGLNDTEVWEVYNTTEDAHPIHLHLVAFQIQDRQPMRWLLTPRQQPQHDGAIGLGADVQVAPTGDAVDPEPWEMGRKDTMIMQPGQVSRVIATFDRPGRYVWHCHILSHEDHEMMRPYHVGPLPQGPPTNGPPGPPTNGPPGPPTNGPPGPPA